MPQKPKNEDAIRNQYAEQGVDAYYQQHGDAYENPHFTQIEKLLQQNQSKIGYTHILDFCAGGGEVSRILQAMGFADVQGCDPYTHELYQQQVGQTCLTYNFQEVIQGRLNQWVADQQPNQEFSSIICSFAMHLCPEKQLYPLVSNLFQLTRQLIIITPHKRPALEDLAQVQLDFEDFTLTKRGKKVKLKSYSWND
ncbi:class I SAM-dependent methyltransferase [uncultured Microscilla sp.]|uniref:class I SAM-dependent methyltransferase n=1 Tax=uncultured Microscilla sp. TaxID=432653 RepID=UPI0026339E5D|nr:class I SAM-dependent methyltransferase [uncultured Microscilla sp.]